MKRLVTGCAVVALALGSTAWMGCGSGGKGNPVKSALDSLPPAPLDQKTAAQAATSSVKAAAGAENVPKASDFASSGTLPSLLTAAVARSSLSLEQKTAALSALGAVRLGPQATTPGCPTVTDNSTYPAGNTVDVTVDAGTGCSAGSGVTLSGKMTLKGTIDATTGAVNLDITVTKFSLTMACQPGSVTLALDGTGKVTATGLTATTASFTVTDSLNVTIAFSGSCNGQSASGSGFMFTDESLTGTRTGNVWSFDASATQGTEVLVGAATVGEYVDWKGNLTVDTKGTTTSLDDTGTATLSGRVGWNHPLLGKGKVDIALNANFDHSVCVNEPVSGTLQLTAGSNKAVVTYDGATPTICGCAPWTLNGATGSPNPLCW